jgi:hypothetical protein
MLSHSLLSDPNYMTKIKNVIRGRENEYSKNQIQLINPLSKGYDI